MGISVYFGFRVGPKELHMAPETREEQAEFYTKVLGEYVSPEDIEVYFLIRDNWMDPYPATSQDMQLAWWKVADRHPLRRVVGSICSESWLSKECDIHLPVNPDDPAGETTDEVLIWQIFHALGFRKEAIDSIDCLYWG